MPYFFNPRNKASYYFNRCHSVFKLAGFPFDPVSSRFKWLTKWYNLFKFSSKSFPKAVPTQLGVLAVSHSPPGFRRKLKFQQVSEIKCFAVLRRIKSVDELFCYIVFNCFDGTAEFVLILTCICSPTESALGIMQLLGGKYWLIWAGFSQVLLQWSGKGQTVFPRCPDPAVAFYQLPLACPN